ncbi:hypothetical protein [Fischerella thermalis]
MVNSSHQPSTTNHQQPTINNQPSTTNHQQPTISNLILLTGK